jgi:hypothetical protein
MEVTPERFDKAIGNILTGGQCFPRLEGESLLHGAIALPDAVAAGRWSVVLTYRAHW